MLGTEKTLTVLLTGASLAVAAIQLLEPVLFGRVIETLSHSQDAFHWLGLWALLGVFNVVSSVFVAVGADRLAHRQRLQVMGQVFERAISLPMSYHTERGSGRVVRAILTGTDQLFALWLAFMREHLASLVSVIALVPVALTLNLKLACLLFVLATIYVFANLWILRRTHGGQNLVEGFHQDLFGRVGDVIGNVTVVQSYTRLVDETRALQEIMARLLSAQYPVLTWWGLLTVITRVSATLTMVSLLGLGSWLATRGEIGVGEIVAFVGFSSLLIGKLDQISSFFARAVTQAPALRNFFDLLDRQDAALESPTAVALPLVRGDVEFRNVTFTYDDRKQGVFGLNFSVRPGQTVALVGASGSGKTTTLALLQRIYDPQEGVITLDGHDVRDLTLASLRHSIATVFQDAGLFNRSIAENIRIGRPSATDAEVEEAARRASAFDFIRAKPAGFQFVIGERGSHLSGGERQRLAIARAILKNAPILVFDEATSALDNETERQIQSSLAELGRDRTTFVIAHRLTTVLHADLVLVFERGRIIEAGPFDTLRTRGGAFARLLAAGELKPKTAASLEPLLDNPTF